MVRAIGLAARRAGVERTDEILVFFAAFRSGFTLFHYETLV